MTDPAPLPIDVSALIHPLPDPAHDAIRAAVLDAIQVVWSNHLDLVAKLEDLATRVTALENPTPAPDPAP